MAVEWDTGREVHTVALGATVHEAAQLMARDALGSLVVVDGEGRAVGMLTDRDLAVRVVGREVDPEGLAVESVMTTPLVSVDVGDSMHAVVERMKTRGVRRLPVLEDGRPVSIVALDDLLQRLALELHDLGAEARSKYRHADVEARFERVRHGVEQRLEDLRRRLAFANWYAREAFLQELDDVREKVREALHVRD